jgi:hypothetical protein
LGKSRHPIGPRKVLRVTPSETWRSKFAIVELTQDEGHDAARVCWSCRHCVEPENAALEKDLQERQKRFAGLGAELVKIKVDCVRCSPSTYVTP